MKKTMNRMVFEDIKHRAAKDVFDGTGYEWSDMLDNTAIADRKAPTDEAEAREYWYRYFEDMLIDLRWEDR